MPAGRPRKVVTVPPSETPPVSSGRVPPVSSDPPVKPVENPVEPVKPAASVSNDPPKDLLADVINRQNSEKNEATPRQGAGRPKGSKTEKKAEGKKVEIDPELVEVGAEITAETELTILDAFGGKSTERDQKILKAVWKYYLKYYGLPAIPGWIVLILGHIAVFGKRAISEENREAIGAGFQKLLSLNPFKKEKIVDVKPTEGKADERPNTGKV